ncbi:MAG: Fic family protein [Kiritimatiellia bacterium]
MSRYTSATGAEAEFEPGSNKQVLRNRLGIVNKREIDQLEFEHLVCVQKKYYEEIEDSTCFNADLICKMQKDWLGDIYDWAGSYRTVELAKNGFRWPPAYLVEKNMADFEASILSHLTPCRPDSIENISLALAKVHAELLLIHPFRDGNGRLARWLADLMALQAGFPLPEYELTGSGSIERKKMYIASVQNGYAQNYKPLASFFAEALDRATR